MNRLFIIFVAIAIIALNTEAAFAASVTIVPTGAGSYSIQGVGMDGVAGIDLTIQYDRSSLSAPTISQGSLVGGALMAVNAGNPGSVKVAIVSTTPFSGSGLIAAVNFASQTGTGGITSASVNMINSKGDPIIAQVTVSGANATPAVTPGFSATAAVPFSQPSSTPSNTTPAATGSTTSTTSSIPTYLGTVSMPSDVQANKNESRPAEATRTPVMPVEAPVSRPVEPPAEEKPVAEPQKLQKPEKVKMTFLKGTLENFQAYKGEKTPASLTALFNEQISPNISQEPSVTMSDGKALVKIVVKIESANEKSPNFALGGAKLVSLNKDSSSAWVIEALPQSGVLQASLTILTDSEIIEYPITVAPYVEGISPAEADFIIFLKNNGASPPKRDLNSDGKHDYQDDFIYTANYLIKKSVPLKTVK